MADQNVNQVLKIDSESAGISRAVQMAQSALEEAARIRAEQAEKAERVVEMQSKSASKEKPAPPVASPMDIHLKFQIDEETKEVTVFVVDRATQKVIRTIPSEELNNLNAGDLVELLA